MDKPEKKASKSSSHKHNTDQPEYYDVRTLLEWEAPGRPFKKRTRQFYFLALLILMLLEVVLYLFSEYQLMLVGVALVFLSFVLASVEPKNFHYWITTEGVRVEDHFYIWEELYDFYFKNVEGVDVVFVRTQALIPGELKLTLGSLSRDDVRKSMVRFLPFREYVKPTFMDKSGDWLSRNFPLDKKKA